MQDEYIKHQTNGSWIHSFIFVQDQRCGTRGIILMARLVESHHIRMLERRNKVTDLFM